MRINLKNTSHKNSVLGGEHSSNTIFIYEINAYLYYGSQVGGFLIIYFKKSV
jgi:hypothetical protein